MKKFIVESRTGNEAYIVPARNSFEALEKVVTDVTFDDAWDVRAIQDQLPAHSDARYSLMYEAACLVARAERLGLHITIERHAMQPLAMGNAIPKVTVRTIRERS